MSNSAPIYCVYTTTVEAVPIFMCAFADMYYTAYTTVYRITTLFMIFKFILILVVNYRSV